MYNIRHLSKARSRNLGLYFPEYRAAVSISPTLLGALASAAILPIEGMRLVTCSPLERAIDRLRRSEDPFDVVLGRHFTPEFLWSDDTYAGTRYPETLSRLGLRFSRFRRLCLTTLLLCLHSSFTMTTCSTCRRVRLTVDCLSTLALRHLITSRLP